MKDFIRCFKQQKFIYKVITICLILVAGLFLFNVIDNSIDDCITLKKDMNW